MLATFRYIILPVLHTMGPILVGFSVLSVVPLAISLIASDGAARGFAFTASISALLGYLFVLISEKDKRELVARDGFLLSTLVWVLIPTLATIPLILHFPDKPFALIFFEMMSATTTTCASGLANLDDLPVSINFWRCFLCWLGGIGIMVLAVAVFPLLGIGGSQLFKSESSGPMKDNKLTPRIADTAKGLFRLYAIISALCALCYAVSGMSLPDAIMHSFTTVSLGGFSTHDASFAFFNNPLIESVAVLFMAISGISFSLHFFSWRKKSFKAYLSSPETRGWFWTLIVSVLIVTTLLVHEGTYDSPLQAFRYAIFNVISVVSTTGFSTANYNVWPVAAPVLMLACACFASSAGSAGGGIKMIRWVVLCKQISREFVRLIHPNAVVPLKVGDQKIELAALPSITVYILLWAGTSVACALALMASGLDATSAISAAIACITNTGPGLGSVGPASNYAFLTDFQLCLCSFCMLLGRLELLTVLVLFTRNFWRL